MKDLSIKKLYYSISEVSKLTGIEQYILRYWETEFEQLKPQKNRAGNRIYTNKDIQLILYIKNLLRERKYTIDGAKKILENYSAERLVEEQNQPSDTASVKPKVEEVNPGTRDKVVLKKDLEEIKNLLEFLLAKL
ncbi:MAG: MerR family transcriptional regulator [Ignavibacterium album]|jgi:DNA-binding transcriptional MerR regulator|uniref:MerR family transcriptional regulator n=1 Tax=Ignavibacterium album TaxID=591197 RepID=A0A7V2ZJX1_9BACT|nr:MerR family transcriptional regulator [Ignavibacterium album]MCX8105335.1 MerR family transcriptional regulator [Ignavibacterium album]